MTTNLPSYPDTASKQNIREFEAASVELIRAHVEVCVSTFEESMTFDGFMEDAKEKLGSDFSDSQMHLLREVMARSWERLDAEGGIPTLRWQSKEPAGNSCSESAEE